MNKDINTVAQDMIQAYENKLANEREMFSNYKIIVIDGVQKLTYKGEVLPHQLKSVVTQGIDELNYGGKAVCIVSIDVYATLLDTIESNE